MSDSHFFHKNIIAYCDRPYKDVDEMNEALAMNWNSVVSEDDTVYHLGDFSFRGRIEPVSMALSILPGKKYLIRGNHDKLSATKYREAGFIEVYKSLDITVDGMTIRMEHIPNQNNYGDVDLYLHGHIHGLKWAQAGPNCFNVSVENINYTPITLPQILDRLGAINEQ